LIVVIRPLLAAPLAEHRRYLIVVPRRLTQLTQHATHESKRK
jgi:hypothetical protein